VHGFELSLVLDALLPLVPLVAAAPVFVVELVVVVPSELVVVVVVVVPFVPSTPVVVVVVVVVFDPSGFVTVCEVVVSADVGGADVAGVPVPEPGVTQVFFPFTCPMT